MVRHLSSAQIILQFSSLVSSSVVDALKADPLLLLAYFYFDFSDPEKQDCRGLVASLLLQIGIRSQASINYLKRERSSDPSGDYPTYESLLSMLFQILGFSGRTYIVIDALDECPESAREKGLLNFFRQLAGLSMGSNVDVHLLVTSRLEHDLRDCMPRFATRTLSFHDAIEQKADLSDHISTQIYDPRSKSYSGWSDVLKARVRQVLVDKSDSM